MIVRWWWFCLVLRNLSISKVTLNKSTTSLFECVLLVVGEVSVRMRVVSGRWSWKRSNISLFKCVYVVGEVSVQMRLCRRWSCKRFNTSLFKCATLLVCTAVWRLLNWVPINNTHSLSGVQYLSIQMRDTARTSWHWKRRRRRRRRRRRNLNWLYILLWSATPLYSHEFNSDAWLCSRIQYLSIQMRDFALEFVDEPLL